MKIKKLNECRWISVISCIGAMLSVGVVYLWSLFQQPVMDYYAWDLTSVTMVPSLLLFFYPIGAMIGGKIQDRSGPNVSGMLGGVLFLVGLNGTSLVPTDMPQLLYLTYSVVCGIGAGFVYNAALVCIQKWFPNNRGMGAGLAIAAFGGATTVFTPVISGLLGNTALGANAVPMTFRTMGFLFGGMAIVFGTLMRNPFPTVFAQGKSIDKKHQYTLREAVRYKEFYICVFVMFFALASFMMVNPIVKTLAISRGMSVGMAELAVSLTGVSSIISRILFPALSDRFGKKKILLVLLCMNMFSAAGLIFAEGMSYVLFIQLAVMAYGGPVGIVSTIVTEAFGTKHAGINSGAVFMFSGISSLIFPRVAAMINVMTGTYSLAFAIGIFACIPCLLLLMGYDRAVEDRVEQEKRTDNESVHCEEFVS